jgi:hypothetical protein
MPQPRELIEPPAYVPGRSSLLAVAQVVEQVSGHWMFGTQWTETTCGSGVVAASGNFQNSAVTDPGAFTHDKLRFAVGYGGIGMIHISPFTATCMAGANLFDTNGSKLATKVGTPVVVGTGYPAPTGGNMVVAGTGPVTIIRSGVRYVPDSLHDSLSPTVNQMTASAQRDYVVGWPCTTVKALATIPT